MKKYGADILRIWVASSNYAEDLRIDYSILDQHSESYRKIRNTFRFIMGNLNDFDEKSNNVNKNDLVEIDKWIISEAINFMKSSKVNDNYAYHHVIQKIHNFCVHELGGVYLDIIKDRMYVTKSNYLCKKVCSVLHFFVSC